MKYRPWFAAFIILHICVLAVSVHAANKDNSDPRNIATGLTIPDEGYCDQPYTVVTDDGAWLCVMTTGPGHEGQGGQHIVAVRSMDKGHTWSAPVAIEPGDGPEASYSVLLKAPGGRVYVFYNYNGDRLKEYNTGSRIRKRVDSLGWFVFKYSDDHGRTWSRDRNRIPIRTMDIDRANPYKGELQLFWNVGEAFIWQGAVYVPVTKTGWERPDGLDRREGVLLKSENLLTVDEPAQANWKTLPDGDYGIGTPPGGGIVAGEHSYTTLDDGTIYCVYRTVDGHPGTASSSDGGHTWTTPAYLTYTNGRRVKHPRAANFVWKCANGKYLYWFHNNGTNHYNNGMNAGSRNIAWMCGGVENNGAIAWSQPEIIFYDDSQIKGASYPDLIEENGRYYITATQKTIARLNEIEPLLIEGLWNQSTNRQMARSGLTLDLSGDDCRAGARARMPNLLPFSGEINKRDMPLEGRGSFTTDFRIRFDDLEPGQIIVDTRDTAGKGFAVTVSDNRTLRFTMCDGWQATYWDCDPGVIGEDRDHHVTIIIDGGPKTISYVIDGVLCDGGSERLFGFGRFNTTFKNINGTSEIRLAPQLHGSLKAFRLYTRYLRTSEAIANFQSGQ